MSEEQSKSALVTRETYIAAHARLVDRGIYPSYVKLLEEIGGGSERDVARIKKEIKAERAGSANTTLHIPERLEALHRSTLISFWTEAKDLSSREAEAVKAACDKQLEEMEIELRDVFANRAQLKEELKQAVEARDGYAAMLREKEEKLLQALGALRVHEEQAANLNRTVSMLSDELRHAREKRGKSKQKP